MYRHIYHIVIPQRRRIDPHDAEHCFPLLFRQIRAECEIGLIVFADLHLVIILIDNDLALHNL